MTSGKRSNRHGKSSLPFRRSLSQSLLICLRTIGKSRRLYRLAASLVLGFHFTDSSIVGISSGSKLISGERGRGEVWVARRAESDPISAWRLWTITEVAKDVVTRLAPLGARPTGASRCKIRVRRPRLRRRVHMVILLLLKIKMRVVEAGSRFFGRVWHWRRASRQLTSFWTTK